jgi:hypothetical protein
MLVNSVQPIFRNSAGRRLHSLQPLSTKGRMKVTRLLPARNLIGCWRNVGPRRRRHPEPYPSDI